MDGMIARRERGYVCAVAVHAVIVAQRDARDARRAARLVAHRARRHAARVGRATCSARTCPHRVYGPELMRRYTARSRRATGHRVWLYGGRDQGSLAQLALNLRRDNPGIRIVGGYSPPFRAADRRGGATCVVADINADRPDVLWVGHRRAASRRSGWRTCASGSTCRCMSAVGAAFDFHAGRISQAPSWMQDRGLEWTYRIAQEPRRLLPRYLYYNPALPRVAHAPAGCAGAAGARGLRTSVPASCSTSVAIVGLGRVGLPLALSFADRGLHVLGIDKDPAVLRADRATRRMPFHETGTQELLERVGDVGPPRALRAAAGAGRRRPHRAHARHAAPSATSRSTSRRSAARSTSCCRCCAEARRSSCARPSRPAPPSGWRATSSSGAASRSARTCSWRTCRSGSPRTTSSRRSPRCRASSAASARRRASAPAELFARFGTEILQTTPGPGRAREDLDEHPALHELRAAEPADDELRAVRRERVRGDRPDQPRLPARRDRDRRGSPPARACARTSRSPRSARARPGCCWRCRACTSRCRCSSSRG